ncbi:MAG TPA: hypothetical protein VIO94_09840 [Phenylobacterium sp.]
MKLTERQQIWAAAGIGSVGLLLFQAVDQPGVGAIGPLLMLVAIVLMCRATFAARRSRQETLSTGTRSEDERRGQFLFVGAAGLLFMVSSQNTFGPALSPFLGQLAMLAALTAAALHAAG